MPDVSARSPPHTDGGRHGWRGLLALLNLAAGIMVLWLFFYYIGQGLLRLPSSFHEGTLWREMPWEKP